MCRILWHLAVRQQIATNCTSIPFQARRRTCSGDIKQKTLFRACVWFVHSGLLYKHGRLCGRRPAFSEKKKKKGWFKANKNTTVCSYRWLYTNENRTINTVFHFCQECSKLMRTKCENSHRFEKFRLVACDALDMSFTRGHCHIELLKCSEQLQCLM